MSTEAMRKALKAIEAMQEGSVFSSPGWWRIRMASPAAMALGAEAAGYVQAAIDAGEDALRA